jgi:acyl-CoA reductase-like NAD-dependent aldehyde dehydrogenase
VPAQRNRLGVRKTYKLYIGGKFPRSESGRSLMAKSADGKKTLANFCRASKKDFRDAVRVARQSQPGWGKASAYLRGQILYRAAEMLEHRSSELVRELEQLGHRPAMAKTEVEIAIDRLVYYAGWSDKFQQLFGSVNPVASSHFNFTVPEPTGVVVIVCPDAPPVAPLVSLIGPAILSGNTVVVIASEKFPLPAITFAEILATSDLPGGVVNILTGLRNELLPHIAEHMDVNAIVDAAAEQEFSETAQAGTAVNLKRYAHRKVQPQEWLTNKAEDPYWILDTIEFKTAWHPIGL